MQRLPDVVTATLTLSLPLCGGTAGRLAAALLDSRDGRASQPLLADALARDPALVLWALVKSHQLGLWELRTIDALAAWLSTAALDQFNLAPLAESSPAESSKDDRVAACEPWVALATRCVGVAALAAEIARQRQLDDQASHLLGLVHLAPEWLVAAGGGSPHASLDVLPPWIAECLDRIGPSPPVQIASPLDCTSAAVHLAQTGDALGPLPCDFVFDRQAHAARLQMVRDDWRPQAASDRLGHLVEKLRRLRDLESNFARTLEAEKLESLKELAYGAGPFVRKHAREAGVLDDIAHALLAIEQQRLALCVLAWRKFGLREVRQRNERTLAAPAPFVRFEAFGVPPKRQQWKRTMEVRYR